MLPEKHWHAFLQGGVVSSLEHGLIGDFHVRQQCNTVTLKLREQGDRVEDLVSPSLFLNIELSSLRGKIMLFKTASEPCLWRSRLKVSCLDTIARQVQSPKYERQNIIHSIFS